MSLSSLWKKIDVNKLLAFIFLVGLLSLTFLVFDAKAVLEAPTAGVTTVTTTYQIKFSFTTTTGDSSLNFGFSSSTNNATWSPTSSIATTTAPLGSYYFVGLATNTRYYFRVAASDGVATSAYATANAYTLADTPGVATLSAAAVQGFTLLINSSTNPAATTYVVRDTASSTRTLYLQNDHTWGVATATFLYTQLLSPSAGGTSTINLATNTLHQISVAAINGDAVTTTYGAVATIYTLATPPAAPTVTSTNPQTLKVIVNANTNPTTASTTFVVRDTVDPASTKYLQSDQTWSTATATFTYAQLGGAAGTTTIGLATNTLHTISVAAVNGDTVTTTYGATASVYTTADTPGTPTLSAPGVQGFTILVNSSTNPAATTYVVRDTASSTRTLYLQNDHTWGVATATFLYTQLLSPSAGGTSTINLATNTLHQISVAAINGDAVTTTYGAVATIYTLATPPAAPTVTSTNPQTLKVIVNANTNPTTASTTFVVRDTVDPASTKYLQSDQTWSTATATFTYAQLGGAAGTTTIGLATSSPHSISVAAVNGDTVTTTYGATVVISTIPNTPTTSVSAAALTTFTVTINSSTNPTSTTYIVRDTGGSTVKYLQTDHTWGTTTATLSFAFVAGLVSTSTTGLSANTLHTISVAAVSSDQTQTSTYSTAVSIYTLANVPSSVVLTAAANSFTLTWSGDSNEEFWAEDSTAGTNSGWITGTSYNVGSINCGTTHTFTVAGRNGDLVVTASSSALSATTNACGGTGSIGVSAPAATPATPAVPAVPGVAPAVPATPASVSLPSAASPVAVFVRNLGVGSKGAEVKQLQQKLRELGFFKHPTNTGLFGPATKAAVVAFQKAQGFRTAPGVVGPATREALNSETAVSAGESAPPVPAPAPAPQVTVGEFVSNLRLGSKGAEVRMLQAKLRELGFFTHPTDTGVFGGVTRAALREFQKDQGLSPVGFVGPGTRAALNSL